MVQTHAKGLVAKEQGSDAAAAKRIIDDARALENAGRIPEAIENRLSDFNGIMKNSQAPLSEQKIYEM